MRQRARRYDFFADAEAKSAPLGILPKRLMGVFVHTGGIAGFAQDGLITLFGAEWGDSSATAHYFEQTEGVEFVGIVEQWVLLCVKRKQCVAA